MYNLGIIFGALFLVKIKALGITGLAWGVVLGAALHFLVQLLGLAGTSFHYQWRFAWREAGVRKIGWLMLPRVLSLSISQFSLLVVTIIASTLATGSLAIFSLASN